MKFANFPGFHALTMVCLISIIHQSHPYAQLYQQAFEVIMQKPPEEQRTMAMRLHAERNQDLRRYNLPATNNEVAVIIIPGDGSEERSDHHDIILRLREGGLQRIGHLHPSYSTLQYPLLFPYGEDGWHLDIPACMGDGGRR